jgi:hypothetical protein
MRGGSELNRRAKRKLLLIFYFDGVHEGGAFNGDKGKDNVPLFIRRDVVESLDKTTAR